MAIAVLEVEHYPPSGSATATPRWESRKARNPAWPDVEAAVRRLNRREWPIVWLHTGEPVDGEMPADPALQIMGGRGEYALMYWDGEEDCHYHDEGRTDRVIAIWESGEGAEQCEENLCNDLDRVLEIARHFAETARPHPDYRWERW